MWIGFFLGLGPAAAIGLGRFAYALVLPAMQTALGLSYTQAGLLGSANTLGYFAGSFLSHRILSGLGYRRGFYGALLLQAMALLLLGLMAWVPALALLRFVQGVSSALVFVGGAALALSSGQSGRGLGVYYGGVGAGILLSPLALWWNSSWQGEWVAIGVFSLLLAALSLFPLRSLQEPPKPSAAQYASLRPIAALLWSYSLYGAGYIGYMTFVTTVIAEKGWFWLVLGFGAMLTGPIWGTWVERVGGFRGLRDVLLVLMLSSLPFLVNSAPWVSAFLFGLSFLGVITAVTQGFRVLLPPEAWPRAMGMSTAAFALGQAVGPSLAGLAGEVVGSGVGALWASSLLLLIALLIAFLPLRKSG